MLQSRSGIGGHALQGGFIASMTVIVCHKRRYATVRSLATWISCLFGRETVYLLRVWHSESGNSRIYVAITTFGNVSICHLQRYAERPRQKHLNMQRSMWQHSSAAPRMRFTVCYGVFIWSSCRVSKDYKKASVGA